MTPTDLAQMFHFLKYLVPSLIAVWVVSMVLLTWKGWIK